MTAIRETLAVASVSVLPGTEARQLAQRLADALRCFRCRRPRPSAPVHVPPDIVGQVRTFAD